MAKFDCNHFVDVAEELINGASSGNPAHIRTVLGRAYYGVYGTLRDRVVTTFGDCFQGAGWHSLVYTVCIESGERNLKKLGKKLQTLCDGRMDADYEWLKEPSKPDAECAVVLARSLLQRVRNLSNDELYRIHSDLTAAIARVQERRGRR